MYLGKWETVAFIGQPFLFSVDWFTTKIFSHLLIRIPSLHTDVFLLICF